MLTLRLTLEQEQILEVRSQLAGFTKKSEYVRTILFNNGNLTQSG